MNQSNRSRVNFLTAPYHFEQRALKGMGNIVSGKMTAGDYIMCLFGALGLLPGILACFF